jgi:tetratricopeptide (TPR) repeat protein
MAKPVFLSMGGKSDAEFALKVKALLPDPMVYFYQRSGEEGVAFRSEIESEVRGCRLFVLFWSDDYFNSSHAKIELALFKKSVEAGLEADLLVVPTTRKYPNIQGKWTNPISSLEEIILGRWRYERAMYQGDDPQRVAENIRRKLAKARIIDRALVARPNLFSQFKLALTRPNFQTVQFGLIWGYEGDGRRTALRQYMNFSHVNLTPRYVPLDTMDGPEDLLLRLHENVSPTERLKVLEDAKEKKDGIAKAIRTALFLAGESKSYYVIALNRYAASDFRMIPNWLPEVFGSVALGNAPLAFIILPNAVTDNQMQKFPSAARIRVPGLEQEEMLELVHKLANEDSNPIRWTEERRALVARVSGGSAALCHAIMYAMSVEPTLEFLSNVADREADVFAANISALVGYLVKQFKDRKNDLLALRVIERLGATSKQTLDSIFASRGGAESYDLYQLREYGLVEHLSGDIYRIPPLVQRRLGDALWAAGFGKEEMDVVLREFASELLQEGDDYGAVFASNKVAAQLRTNTPVPDELDSYLTISTLFKAGLERYTNNEFSTAYDLFKKAMYKLQSGAIIDPIVQLEVARYFGLTSARLERFDAVSTAREFIKNSAVRFPQPQADSIVAFLSGFEYRVKGQYKYAVQSFETARDLLYKVRFAERQRGAVLTELSRALLRLSPPSFERAVSIANEAYVETKVVHNLNGLIRAMLARLEGEFFDGGREVFESEVEKVIALIDLLTEMCQRSGQDFHFVRRADLARIAAYQRKRSSKVEVIDLSEAIKFVRDALQLKKFSPTISKSWYLRVFDEKFDHSSSLMEECQLVLNDKEIQDRVYYKDALTILIILKARKDKDSARLLLRNHQNNVSDSYRSQLNNIIAINGRLGREISDYARYDRI